MAAPSMPDQSCAPPLALICGDDDFTVRRRARTVFDGWRREVGGMDHEEIDAGVAGNEAAIKAVARLRESLLTLPFFGTGKVIWFKDCSFLGEEIQGAARVRVGESLNNALGGLAAMLKSFDWQSVRLLISAGKVDKRRTFYKTLEKAGKVEVYEALSADDRDWESKVRDFARHELQARGKTIAEAALEELAQAVGPSLALAASEVEKLALYTASRPAVETNDVRLVVSRQKTARAFALGDALGARNVPALLECLDEELWAMRLDKKRSEIGLLYGLISKVRTMLLAKALAQEGLLRPGADSRAVKNRMAEWPAERFAEDKKYNPQSINPFVLSRALEHSAHYTMSELVDGMEILLEANLQLVTSGQDEALVLQRALVRLAGTPSGRRTRSA